MVLESARRSRKHLPVLCAVLVIGLPLVVAVALALGTENPSRLQLFVGRLHPFLVHLPIGFLVLAVLLEALSRAKPFVRLRHAMPVVLVLSAASAIIAVLAGYLLAASGAHEGSTIAWHKRLGMGVAVGSLVASFLWYAARVRPRLWLRRAYAGSLLATFAMLMAAGHLGGTLTHGPDYLTEYMPAPMLAALQLLPGQQTSTPVVAHRDEVDVYEHLVRPVLQARCVSCHGPNKQSGGLRLDSPEGIRKGGDTGPALVASNTSESELIRRIWLPEDHELHMPPRGRKPLTVAEAELLRWWVEQGGAFSQLVAQADPPRIVREILEQIAGPMDVRRPPILRTQVASVDAGAVERAKNLGLSITPLSDDAGFLQVHCINAADPCGTAQVEMLLPLAEQITFLDLSRTGIGDQDLAIIGRLPHLTRLRLEQTAITDAGLTHLSGLQHLEYLNLYGTAITDVGLQSLSSLENLRSLYLWQTAVTQAGAERLRQQLARLEVKLGLSQTAMDSLRIQTRQDSARAAQAY
jgi:uncharacterized membrane protein/mono/diheme cytochrome c family protein